MRGGTNHRFTPTDVVCPSVCERAAAPQRHQSTEKTKRQFPGCCASKRALAEEDSLGRNRRKVPDCVKSQAHLRGGRQLNPLRGDERFDRRRARGEKMKRGEAGKDSAVLHGG